jgi:hypothetical protein
MDGLEVDHPRPAGSAWVAPWRRDSREASDAFRRRRSRPSCEAKSDSPLRFVILSVALGHAQVPACGKRLRGRLREELADKGLIFLLS